MAHYQEKLQLGLERLRKAGNDADLLGLAVTSLHGALEDYFRAWLASSSHVPHQERTRVLDVKQVQWKELLDLMQQYGNLSQGERSHILRINKLRQVVGHGSPFTGTRTDLENYANYVQRRIAQNCSSTHVKEETSHSFEQRGDDLRLDLKLSFREAVLGGEKQIRISHLETCPTCSGLNSKKLGEICSTCNGKGLAVITKALKITIPAGVDNGTRLRIAGEGDVDLSGNSPGDLYVYLFVDEDPDLKRDGINILSNVTITSQLALSGCKLNMIAVDASGELEIPPRIKHGTVLRLKNRGVPKLGNPTERGDHLVKVNIISGNEGDTSKSDTDRVLEITKKLEYLLETKYRASGRGLHEKVSSVESQLDPQLVKDLRAIATIRNKVFHEFGYNFAVDKDKFFQIGNSAISRVENAATTNSQTYSSYSPNSSTNTRTNSSYRNYSYSKSYKSGTLRQWVLANVCRCDIVRQWKKYGLFWQWFAANIYGAVVGAVLSVAAALFASFILPPNLSATLLPLIMISTLFLKSYLAQQVVLSDILKKAHKWSLVSMVGFWLSLGLTAIIIGLSSNNPLLSKVVAFPVGLLFGLPIGLMQWLVLRQQIAKANWWILASSIDWVVFAASWAFVNSVFDRSGILTVIVGIFIGAIAGKAVTGKTLVYLFSGSNSHER